MDETIVETRKTLSKFAGIGVYISDEDLDAIENHDAQALNVDKSSLKYKDYYKNNYKPK